MAVYILVFAVFIVVLFAAYRSLGVPAGSLARPEDLLAAVHRDLTETLRLVDSDEAEPEVLAKQVRRTAAGAAHQLAHAGDDEELADAAALLGAAADDCGWAGRLMEAEGYAGNPGMQAAVAALVDHARRCVAQVQVEAAEDAPVPG